MDADAGSAGMDADAGSAGRRNGCFGGVSFPVRRYAGDHAPPVSGDGGGRGLQLPDKTGTRRPGRRVVSGDRSRRWVPPCGM